MTDTSSKLTHITENNAECPHSTPLPPTVWLIGAIMFLMNMSYVMVFSLSAVYFRAILGVGVGWIGALEGITEGLSYVAKLMSGVISDYLRRRKIVIVLGYALQVLSRPILAFSSSIGLVVASICIERLGNGIQSTPRDALISDVAPPSRKGASFGLKRSISQAGSVFGAVIGIFLMWLTAEDFKQVFMFATIPAAIAFCILVFAVKDPKKTEEEKAEHTASKVKRRTPIQWKDLPRLGNKYWYLMAVVFMFMVARVGEHFLVLHASEDFGLAHAYIPTIMIMYNATYSLSVFPLAKLSDRMNRYVFLMLAIAMLILADLTLFAAPGIEVFFVGVAFWGVQMGLAQSLFAALIADIAPKDLRGTAFGFYYITSGAASVFAGAGGGLVAHNYDIATTYLASSVIAACSMIGLVVLMVMSKNFTMKRIPHHH
ncbi:MAG: MFS transporter [Alphaproteobacteria bacterium]|nr:MFS transporter [Alphaproteobacteria bacterium]